MKTIVSLCLGIVFLLVVLVKIRRNRISENESLFWTGGSIFLIIISLNARALDWVATKLTITYPPTLLLVLGNLFSLYLLFRQSEKISILHEKQKELAQRFAILEYESNLNSNTQHKDFPLQTNVEPEELRVVAKLGDTPS